jgi:pimeloyl-ACP methyl ester carboxylesterase
MSRVALVGHSMGGVKAIWFAAHVSSPQVSAVIALSPPRFCHESLSGPPNGEAYLAEYSRASQLVAEGRPETLLAVKQPLAYLVTASSYLDKHGPHDRYDFVRLVPKLACPLLVLVGSRTLAESQAFLGMPEALLAVSGCRERVDLRVVEGADIHYLNRREAPLQEAATWLSQVLPQ